MNSLAVDVDHLDEDTWVGHSDHDHGEDGPSATAQSLDLMLDVALELSDCQVYDCLAIPDVALQSGLQVQRVYEAFGTTTGLVNALYYRWQSRLMRQVLESFPLRGTARRQFHVLWRRMTDFAFEHPRAFDFLSRYHGSRVLDERNLSLNSRLDEVILAIVGRTLEVAWKGAVIGLIRGALSGLVASGQVRTLDQMRRAEARCWAAVLAFLGAREVQ